jgi:hypothetical protein
MVLCSNKKSYFWFRWITAKWASSRNLLYHKIISAVVAAMNENPTFPVIAEGTSEKDRCVPVSS